MEYDIMIFQECPRCDQFEHDHVFMNCGFSMTKLQDGTVLQEFECSRCGFKWERKYENRSNNGSTFWGKTGQSELF